MNDYVAGSTNVVESVFIPDSASTTGAGKTGLAYNTSGLTCYYKRSNGTAAVAVSLVNITTLGTFVSGGFKEVDATHMPGDYEFHPPDAAFAAGAKWVKFYFVGASGMVATRIKVRIKAVNPDDGVRFGITALPAAIANAANGLPTKPSGDTVLGQLTVGPTYTPFIQPMAVWVVANDASHYCKLSDNYALAYGSVDGWSVIWNVGAGVWKVTRPDGSIYAGGYYHSIAGESQYSYESGPTDWDAMYTTPATVAVPGDAMTLTSDYDAAKTAAQVGSAMTLTGDYDAAKTAITAGQVLTEFNGKLAAVANDGSENLVVKTFQVYDGDNDVTVDVGVQLGEARNASVGNATTIDAIKVKTDNLPMQPAAVGSAMTLTSAYDAAKDAVNPAIPGNKLHVSNEGGVVLSTSALADIENVIAPVKAKTDNLPSDPADESDLEAKLDEIIENTGASPGAIETTLVIKSSGQPVQGAQVWVTTDSAGENTVAGASPTDVDGKVVFYLEAGTYYRFAYKPGYTFTNPSSFTVTA